MNTQEHVMEELEASCKNLIQWEEKHLEAAVSEESKRSTGLYLKVLRSICNHDRTKAMQCFQELQAVWKERLDGFMYGGGIPEGQFCDGVIRGDEVIRRHGVYIAFHTKKIETLMRIADELPPYWDAPVCTHIKSTDTV
jgi:hypothetical protein